MFPLLSTSIIRKIARISISEISFVWKRYFWTNLINIDLMAISGCLGLLWKCRFFLFLKNLLWLNLSPSRLLQIGHHHLMMTIHVLTKNWIWYIFERISWQNTLNWAKDTCSSLLVSYWSRRFFTWRENVKKKKLNLSSGTCPWHGQVPIDKCKWKWTPCPHLVALKLRAYRLW